MKVGRTATTILLSCACTTLAEAQSPAFQQNDTEATSSPRSVATADFNRDGRPDLALCGIGRKSVTVLLNGDAGTSSFTLASEIVVGSGAFELAAGDLNRDGKPNLVVANADADAVDILIGAGDGTFRTRSRVDITGGAPRGVTIADDDRDGMADIIVTETSPARKTTRPGTAKSDATKLELTWPWLGCWDRCSPE